MSGFSISLRVAFPAMLLCTLVFTLTPPTVGAEEADPARLSLERIFE